MPIRFLLFFALCLSAQAQRIEKVLYIRGQFPDRAMPLSDQEWTKRVERIHSKLNEYWQNHSYGKIALVEASITPPLTLPGKTKDYYDYNALATGMKKAAEKADFALKNYNHVVFLYPGIKHNISFGGLGGGGQIWLPGSNPYDGGLIHEFGHSLGVGHSNSIEGKGRITYPGQRREGRDGLHMMGSDGNGRIGDYSTINVPMRYHLKFVDDEHIHSSQKSGVYRIHEYETTLLSEKTKIALRMKIKGEDFWISFNPKMKARWANFSSRNFAKGLIIHRKVGSVTDLLDFTPGSNGKTDNEKDYIDTRDGGLAIGKAFKFPGSKITITPQSIGKSDNGLSYIDVEISRSNSTSTPQVYKIAKAQGTVTHTPETITIEAHSGLMDRTSDSCLFYASHAKKKDKITASIASFLGSKAQSQAGVMMRAGKGSSVPQASIMISGAAKLSMIWRPTHGAASEATQVEFNPAQLKRLSLRLSRDQETITGEYSLDGKNWNMIKSVSIPTGQQILKGLAISSSSHDATVTAKFEDVNLLLPE